MPNRTSCSDVSFCICGLFVFIKMLGPVLFPVLLLVLNIRSFLAEYTIEECKELGYIKTELMCSSCEKLADFDLQELKEHCKECCQNDIVSSASKRYPKAVLEVCTCKFGAYPQIQAFIKSDKPSKFPNLQIRYVRGLDPIVKLIDKNDNVKETLSITKWNTDTVVEFFETHLEKVDEEDNYLKTNEI